MCHIHSCILSYFISIKMTVLVDHMLYTYIHMNETIYLGYID